MSVFTMVGNSKVTSSAPVLVHTVSPTSCDWVMAFTLDPGATVSEV